MRPLPILTATLLAAACTESGSTPDDWPADAPEDAVDVREDFPEPAWADPLVLRSEPYVIPPGEEKQFCLFDTWEGGDLGVAEFIAYQNQGGHHFIIASTTSTQREVADGTIVDCTETESAGMENFQPLIIGGVLDVANRVNTFELPEGMAARLKDGQRIILQSHYINTTPDPIVVQDELQLRTLAPEDVDTWAAPFVNTDSDMVIPPAQSPDETFSLEVECTWDKEYTVLYLGGHLHEYGHSFAIDHLPADAGDEERIYEIADWDPLYRDAPPFADFGGEDFVVQPGDTFRTTCTWHNDSGGDLAFPSEMCVGFGMVYPAGAPVMCTN